MRYMLLMYRDEKWWDAKPEAERIAIRQQAIDASEPLRQRGIFLAGDPLLPAVAWTWLTDALEQHAATYTAIGGTITQTASTRFGELAGPAPTADLEVRASWTPTSTDTAAHLLGWCAMLASTAGLPPPGVTALNDRHRVG